MRANLCRQADERKDRDCRDLASDTDRDPAQRVIALLVLLDRECNRDRAADAEQARQQERATPPTARVVRLAMRKVERQIESERWPDEQREQEHAREHWVHDQSRPRQRTD